MDLLDRLLDDRLQRLVIKTNVRHLGTARTTLKTPMRPLAGEHNLNIAHNRALARSRLSFR